MLLVDFFSFVVLMYYHRILPQPPSPAVGPTAASSVVSIDMNHVYSSNGINSGSGSSHRPTEPARTVVSPRAPPAVPQMTSTSPTNTGGRGAAGVVGGRVGGLSSIPGGGALLGTVAMTASASQPKL
jgi:hypothetical protein